MSEPAQFSDGQPKWAHFPERASHMHYENVSVVSLKEWMINVNCFQVLNSATNDGIVWCLSTDSFPKYCTCCGMVNRQ